MNAQSNLTILFASFVHRRRIGIGHCSIYFPLISISPLTVTGIRVSVRFVLALYLYLRFRYNFSTQRHWHGARGTRTGARSHLYVPYC